jgi:predicted PurR-regulated permease PerM
VQIQLSERQQATVATAITILAALVIVLAIGGVFWLLGLFAARFSSVFLPLAVAAVAALVFKPYFTWLRRQLRLPKIAAVIAVFLSMLVPLVGFVWFFGALVVEQLRDLIDRAPQLWDSATATAKQIAPRVAELIERYPILEQLGGTMEGSQDALVSGLHKVGNQALAAGMGVLAGIGALLGWVVTPVYFAFFLLVEPRVKKIEQFLPFLKQSTRDDLVYLAREFVNIVVAFFRGQLIIAFLQGLLFAIGFSLVGLRYGFVIGLVLGFLNIIPYLGNIVGLATALPLAYLQAGGGWGRIGMVLVVFAIVQVIEGYVLTPKIMGDRTGLHPMVIIVAIFFWGTALSGILGMILAIPLTAFLAVFWRLAREKYMQELV